MVTKHVIPRPDLHCAGPLALRGFLQHLPAKYKSRPKNPTVGEQGPGTEPYGKYSTALVIALRS